MSIIGVQIVHCADESCGVNSGVVSQLLVHEEEHSVCEHDHSTEKFNHDNCYCKYKVIKLQAVYLQPRCDDTIPELNLIKEILFQVDRADNSMYKLLGRYRNHSPPIKNPIFTQISTASFKC